MLLIKSIKTTEVLGDTVTIATQLPSINDVRPWEGLPQEETIKTELIRGRRFRYTDGKEVCIGMTKEVAEVLNMPFDIYQDMATRIANLEKEIKMVRGVNFRLTHRLKVIRGMGFWERLNRVFVGFYTLNLR